MRIDEREHQALDDKLAAIREENSVLIDRAIKIGGQISAEFEQLVSSGRITFDDLFDNNYMPIEGTDPVQYSTRFLASAGAGAAADPESALRRQSEHDAMFGDRPQRLHPGASAHALAAATPRRADLERTQLPQPAHLRRSRCGSPAARSTRPYTIQQFRHARDGDMMLIRSVAAPIRVFGKHWGAIRTTYQI